MMLEILEQTSEMMIPQIDSSESMSKVIAVDMDELLRNLPLSKFLKLNALDTEIKKDILIAKLIAASKNPGDIAENSKYWTLEQKNFFLYHTIINNWLFGKTNSELKSWSIILWAPSKQPELYNDLKTIQNDFKKLKAEHRLKLESILNSLKCESGNFIDFPVKARNSQLEINEVTREYIESMQKAVDPIFLKLESKWWKWPTSWWKN